MPRSEETAALRRFDFDKLLPRLTKHSLAAWLFGGYRPIFCTITSSGSVMVAARNPNADKWAVCSRQKLFRQNVEELRRDLQELVVETVTDERRDLSIFQVEGSKLWRGSERYPSLRAYATDVVAQKSFLQVNSAREIPDLFERAMLGVTDEFV